MSAHERERLSAWLDDELPPAERAEVDEHLAECAECRTRLAEMGTVGEMAREEAIEAPAGYFETFAGRVRARIESEEATVPRAARGPAGPGRWRVPAWTWAAAAALILAVVTPLTMVRLGRDGTPVAPDERAPAPTTEARVTEERVARTAPVAAVGEDRDAPVAAEEDPAPKAQAKGEAGRTRLLEQRAGEPRPDDALESAVAAPAPLAAPPGPLAPVPASAPAPPPAQNRARAEAKDVGGFAAAPVAEEEAREEPARPATVGPRRQTAMADAVATGAPREVGSVRGGRGEGDAAHAKSALARAGALREGLDRRDDEASTEDARAFSVLARESPADAAAWRAHREAWRGFVADHPHSPLADEARVRAIEAGLAAWRAGGATEDLGGARADAEAYLARDDAQLDARVRQALETVEDQ